MNHGLERGVGRRWVILSVGCGLAGTLALSLFLWCPRKSTPPAEAQQLLHDAKAALKRGEFRLAEEFASRIDRDSDVWSHGRLVVGEAAMRTGQLDTALDHFRSIPRDGSSTSVLAAFSFAEVAREIGRLSDAENAYAYVLEQQPDHSAARMRMAFLLGVTGRRWESLPHFMALVRGGHATFEELALLGDLERPLEQGEFLQRCSANAPDDMLVRLGLATHAMVEGRSTEARRLLSDVVAQSSRLIAAQVMLGELLVNGDDTAFAEWHEALPADADASPDTWFVRGLWSRRQGELAVAARCFWETVRRAPTHRRGNYQLGQVLIALGESSGPEFVERASQLFELTRHLDQVLRSEGQSEPAVRRVTELLENVGRAWEAYAWANVAAETFPFASWPRSTAARLSADLNDRVPQTLDAANLAMRHDLSSLPLHTQLFARIPCESSSHPKANAPSMIHFVESDDVGLDFTYVNGGDPETKGARMFEQTGGGVAVLDFDGDRRPDLYFAQGADWRQGETTPTLSDDTTDRLFWNIGGQFFVDVTRQAGFADREFGQGVTVGDFNEDGFPELYVANIGRNQLHRNNGDGTFSDVTTDSGLVGEAWTASCLMVDLNSDGFVDLFDVTYLTGSDVFTAICQGRACSPKVFEGLPDRLHLSRGDGTLEFVPDITPTTNSKGLGIVAADLWTRGRPSLFVANDQVPNYLLHNSPADDRWNIRFRDDGFVSGLAFNVDGLAMASMGIAADDANGDGRLDFLVTTFKDEASMLFLQDASGLFVDATNASGLRGPSLPYVGWGAQFLDADLDGAPDLVVANGHVDDYRDVGGEYHMRPQFFRNTGGGRFVELESADVGPFFGKKFLGRGLARLDWNGDGRMDFVVSNIGDRASLVTNRTADVGHFLNVRLQARTTARDAIGSVVEVIAGERRWSKQLVAGDGYMASNERVLQFGLGTATTLNEVRVHWPSGSMMTLARVPVDSTIQLIENAAHGVGWKAADDTSFMIDAVNARDQGSP